MIAAGSGTAGPSRGLATCDRALATVYDTALLDLDGVVYLGDRPVPGAVDHLNAARALGMNLAYVTNNASRTPDAIAEHLRTLGIDAEPGEVVTSAQAAARLVAEQVPAGARVLVVGGQGLVAALEGHGLVPVRRLEQEPVAVVQGWAPDVDWQALAEGALAVGRGLPWIAANLDRTIPTSRGRAPGNGTLVDAIAAAAGRRPDGVAGKPELPLHREAVLRSGAVRPLVVGDRLDTDIEGANRAGTDSLLVFTGVTDPAELMAAGPAQRPRFVAPDLAGLLGPQRQVDVHAGAEHSAPTASCGQARARVDGGHLELQRSGGDPTDALRAACELAWRHLDRTGVALEPTGQLLQTAVPTTTGGTAA